MTSDPDRHQFFSKVRQKLTKYLPLRRTRSTSAREGSLFSRGTQFETLSHSSTPDLPGSTEHEGDYGPVQHTRSLPSPQQPRTINVVLFGDPGVRTGSIINLIAQKEIAIVSPNVDCHTMQSTRYDVTFDDMNFAIFDTVGLEEPQMGVDGYLKAIEGAYELIMKLNAAGGIHLLLFCMHDGRITAASQSNYRLFCDCLCCARVPIALVFTGLGREVEMEDWWTRNQVHVEQYGIKNNGHTCIATVKDGTPGEDLKYTESQKRIRELLKTCTLQSDPYLSEGHTWLGRLERGVMSFIEKHRELERKKVMWVLTHHCRLDPETASKIADIMEKGDAEIEEREHTESEAESRSDSPSILLRIDEAQSDAMLQGEVCLESSRMDCFPRKKILTRERWDGPSFPHPMTQSGEVAMEAEPPSTPTQAKQPRKKPAAAAERAGLELPWLKGGHELRTTNLVGMNPPLTIPRNDVNAVCRTIGAERSIRHLRERFVESQKRPAGLALALHAYKQKGECEILYGQGHSIEAAESLLGIVDSKVADANGPLADWISEFTNRCISTLERIGDEASNMEEHDTAISAYSILLRLGPPTPNSILNKWARMALDRGSADDALNASMKFKCSRSSVCQTICDILEGNNGRVTEAVTFFRQMRGELEDTNIRDKGVQWKLDFQQRCAKRLEKFGSVAMNSKNYTNAAEYFSTMLLLDSVDRMKILTERSKARVSMKSWKGALSDADEVIRLDPSSHRGYEVRHAALHGERRYAEAVEAFRTMLLKLEESPDEHIRELRRQYVDATPVIQRIVEDTIRDLPQVLIDTATGSLYDKKQQAEAFTTLPIYTELISSMARRIDEAYIRARVEELFRYVMLSHKWGNGEPLLQEVQRITVYKLNSSTMCMKLKDFCLLARSLGFRWAWSDTCCIDRDNKRVLEESLVAMFTWYRGSSLTIVYLHDISSLSQRPGSLRRSIWNTRAWTYQEYVAANVVKFYTSDWKPYLGSGLSNHKDSHIITSEIQQATAGSAGDITVLHPGLDRVREKLSLASMRQAALVEDLAYSLLGIFKASILVQYGERDRAVGRLLEYILTGSKDVTILAWTGRAGGYSSYLPVDLTVYNQALPSHVPRPIENSKMNKMVTALYSSLSSLPVAKELYDRLEKLPPPVSLSSRLQLPGLVFRLPDPIHIASDAKLSVYRFTTPIFGDVKIKTANGLRAKRLYIMHPWIRPLLDQEFEHGAADLDHTTQAVRFAIRLRQRFGALLLEQVSHAEYRRVAADSLVMVQFGKEVSLTELIQNIRTIEIQ